jgi:hypothetical protein
MWMITAISSATPELTAKPELAVLRESVEAPYKSEQAGRPLPNMAVNDLAENRAKPACPRSSTALQHLESERIAAQILPSRSCVSLSFTAGFLTGGNKGNGGLICFSSLFSPFAPVEAN